MIYIACPEKFATGGTELLHQLYYKLSKLNVNVRMYYYNYSNTGSPVNDRFLKYDVSYVNEIQNSNTNLLIVPEIGTNLFKKFSKVKKCIWWLSVDFYYINSLGKKNNIIDSLIFIMKKIIKRDYFSRFVNFKDDNILHLYQSYYAEDFLIKKGVKKSEYLSDYIGSNFLNEQADLTHKKRINRVLYNPKKGIEFTRKLIAYDNHIEYIPLINMSQEQIIELCKTSKVYIDFGNHPGKDRFPREAAHLGCVIITGKRGSAKFNKDVMIPESFKFEDDTKMIPYITEKIRHVFTDENNIIDSFDEYRQIIKSEENAFENDVKKIYEKYLTSFAN